MVSMATDVKSPQIFQVSRKGISIITIMKVYKIVGVTL